MSSTSGKDACHRAQVGHFDVTISDTLVVGGSVVSPGVGTGSVTSVGTGTGLTGGPITTTGTITLANTAVTPGSYTLMSATVDQQGRLTAASTGTAVTSVATGTGLTGGPITTTGTVNLANTTVVAGSYINSSITVDAQGRLTSASSGAATPVAVFTSAATSFAAANTDVSPAALTIVKNVGGFSTVAGAVIFPANGDYRVMVSSAYVLQWDPIAATTTPADTQIRQQVLLNPGAVVQGNGGSFDRLETAGGSITPLNGSTQETFMVTITNFAAQSIIPRALYTVDAGDWDMTHTVAFYVMVDAL